MKVFVLGPDGPEKKRAASRPTKLANFFLGGLDVLREHAAVSKWKSLGSIQLHDIEYTRENVSVISVARELGLAVIGKAARCWRAENHKNGDRTPSMSVWHNRIHCHRCDPRSYSNIDLVQKVLGLPEGPKGSPEQREGTRLAMEWIAQRFNVPDVAAEIEQDRPYRPSLDIPEDLIGSGVLGELTPAPRCVVFALVTLCKRGARPLSYEVLKQLSGVKSDHVVVQAIAAVESIGLLSVQRGDGDGLSRNENIYTLTPGSPEYQDALATAMEKRGKLIDQHLQARQQKKAARRAERAAAKAEFARQFETAASPMSILSKDELAQVEVPCFPETEPSQPRRAYLGNTLCSQGSDEQCFTAVRAATILSGNENKEVLSRQIRIIRRS